MLSFICRWVLLPRSLLDPDLPLATGKSPVLLGTECCVLSRESPTATPEIEVNHGRQGMGLGER